MPLSKHSKWLLLRAPHYLLLIVGSVHLPMHASFCARVYINLVVELKGGSIPRSRVSFQLWCSPNSVGAFFYGTQDLPHLFESFSNEEETLKNSVTVSTKEKTGTKFHSHIFPKSSVHVESNPIH